MGHATLKIGFHPLSFIFIQLDLMTNEFNFKKNSNNMNAGSLKIHLEMFEIEMELSN